MHNYLPYLGLVFGWLLFGAIHSLLATQQVKKKIGLSELQHRRLYNVTSMLLLLALLIFGATINRTYFLANSKANKAIGLMVATFGYLLIKMAFKQISFKGFLGITEDENTELITTGIYARMRHPLYTATILLVIGFAIFNPTLTNLGHVICAIIYIIVGTYFEEKKLVKTFGEQYEKYKMETPMLFPKLR